MIGKCGVAAINGVALGHVAGDALLVVLMRSGQSGGVASEALGVDVDRWAMRLVATTAPEAALTLTGAFAESQLLYMTDDAQIVARPIIDGDGMRLWTAGWVRDASFSVEVTLLANCIAIRHAQARRIPDVMAGGSLQMLTGWPVALLATDGLQGFDRAAGVAGEAVPGHATIEVRVSHCLVAGRDIPQIEAIVTCNRRFKKPLTQANDKA